MTFICDFHTLCICGDGNDYGDGYGHGPFRSDSAQRSNGWIAGDSNHHGYGDGIDYGDAEGNGWLNLEDLVEGGTDMMP